MALGSGRLSCAAQRAHPLPAALIPAGLRFFIVDPRACLASPGVPHRPAPPACHAAAFSGPGLITFELRHVVNGGARPVWTWQEQAQFARIAQGHVV
jgi:hypothetical protein